MKYPTIMYRIAQTCALGAGMVGVSTLVGHAAGWHMLASLGASDPIKGAVALGLLAGSMGVAGLLAGRLLLVRAGGVGMLLLVAATLLCPQSQGDWFCPSPTIMVVMALLGTSLIAFSVQNPRIAERCVMVAGALALFAMMRTLFDVTGAGEFSSLAWITFPAAFGLLLLTNALLLAEPRSLMVRLLSSKLIDGDMARWMLPAVMVLPGVLAVLQMIGNQGDRLSVDFVLALMMTALICMLVVVTLFTGVKLRALALAENEERTLLEDAQTLARLSGWVLDRASGRVDYSPQFGVMFGVMPDRLQPGFGGLLALVCDRDRIAFAAGIDALSTSDPMLQVEITMCHADGDERRMLVRARVKVDEDGRVTHVVGTILDMTEFRRNESALAERERRLSTLLQSIGDAVISTDTSGRVEHMNPVAQRMTGWTFDEARGRPLTEVFHIINERTRMPVENPVARVLREGSVVGLANHTALVRRDGDERSIADSAAPIRDAANNITGVVMVFHDVTNERIAAEEQERLRVRLAAADRMASLGLLASGIAHEMNNPLSYMIGALSLLETSVFNGIEAVVRDSAAEQVLATFLAEGRDLLADCHQGAERVRRIVADLNVLGCNRDDDHNHANVRETLELALRIGANKIYPRARVETTFVDVPPVAMGSTRLGQVLLNLLVNAAQAIPEGASEDNLVRVACGLETNGEQVLIEVEDTGCGIAAENMPRVFNPFFTTKPLGVGTGLGLSICHSIVTAAAGEIEVDSTPGKGTRFRIRLPVARHEVPVPADVQPKRVSLRRGRILIIDDDPLVAKILVRILEPDHDAVAITQSVTALERLGGGEHFDAVLCDLMMPGLTGMELYMRLTVTRPSIQDRFIFMTGGALSTAAQDFMNSYAQRCLGKPIDKRLLNDLLRKVMSEDQGQVQTADTGVSGGGRRPVEEQRPESC